MEGQQLFRNQGDGPAATWLTDVMRTIGNAPTGFQNISSRPMETESVASPPFRQMMEDKVEAMETRIPRVAAGSNRRRTVTVMMPEETAAARSLAELRDNDNSTEAENSNKEGSDLPANPIMTAIASIPLPPSTPTLIESLKSWRRSKGRTRMSSRIWKCKEKQSQVTMGSSGSMTSYKTSCLYW